MTTEKVSSVKGELPFIRRGRRKYNRNTLCCTIYFFLLLLLLNVIVAFVGLQFKRNFVVFFLLLLYILQKIFPFFPFSNEMIGKCGNKKFMHEIFIHKLMCIFV